jgi:hypothetical protein
MAFTPIADFTHKIQELGQKPNAEQGMTWQDVLGRYQLPSDELLTALRLLLTELAKTDDNSSGADNIGATAITGIGTAETNTIQKILEALKTYIDKAIQDVVLGQIPDNSLPETKLSTDVQQKLPTVSTEQPASGWWIEEVS